MLAAAASSGAEVLVRWSEAQVPAPEVLGVRQVVLPAGKREALDRARQQGYDVYVEHATEPRIERHGGAMPRALPIDRRGKWPHIRTNWVTRRGDVLQVAGRSAQPWLDNNAALIRIIDAERALVRPLLTYEWKPPALSGAGKAPALADYLVAIAEAGSFGGDLLLPVDERFANDLLLGKPAARADWKEIRRYLEFYAEDLPSRYRAIADVAVVAPDPAKSFEVMNLLARHNVPFALVDPARATPEALTPFALLVSAGAPADSPAVAAFTSRGGTVLTAKPSDPNGFALEVRRQVGREKRALDIWNGVTVIAAPYAEPDGKGLLLTFVNYAAQPLPIQIRVRGAFSQAYFESPEQEATLLPVERRDGHTELTIPALRIGGRVFLY
jgi:hypothetical protein